MIKNESFKNKIPKKYTKYQKIGAFNILKPYSKKDKVPTTIIFRNTKHLTINKKSISNISQYSSNLSHRYTLRKNTDRISSKESFNEKLQGTKYLDNSLQNDPLILEHSNLNYKKESVTFRESIRYPDEISKTQRNILNISTRDIKKKKFPKLNLKYKNSLIKKIRHIFLTNRDYKNIEENFINARKYKQNLKKINSSFSQESRYSFEKKLLKDISNNNFLFNNTTFNSTKKIDGKNISKRINSKDTPEKNNYHTKREEKKNNDFRKIFKYELINNSSYHDPINIKKWKEYLEKMRINVEKIIDRSINSKHVNHFSIVDRSKFKKRYQSIDVNEKQKIIDKAETKVKYKDLINPDVYKNYIKLLDYVDEEKEKMGGDLILKKIKEKHELPFSNKKTLKERFRTAVIKISNFLKQRKISDSDLTKLKLIEQSFAYPQTQYLINSIKKKDLELSYRIINNHKYIVLDFDYLYLTPLHWAVKRNFYQILPPLLDYGSMVDANCLLGETPLHIAVKNNFYDCACILLIYLASPFIKDKNGQKPIDLTNDFDMKSLLTKATKLHYNSYFHKTLKQTVFIQTGLWTFIKEEFEHKLKDEVFEYIKGKVSKDFFTFRY